MGASAEEAAGSAETSVSIGSTAAGAKIVQFTVDGGRTQGKVQKTKWKLLHDFRDHQEGGTRVKPNQELIDKGIFNLKI